MSDDLKGRLRKLEGGDKYGSTVWYRNPDGPEAASRIEKLEAANLKQSCIKVDDQMRIEKLEAALREIASGKYSGRVLTSMPPQDPAVNRAKQALEGKDDPQTDL